MKKLALTSAIVLTVVCLSLAFVPGTAQAGHYNYGNCGGYSYYPTYSHCNDYYVPYTPVYTYSHYTPHCYY